MPRKNNRRIPNYCDGVLKLYRLEEDTESDYPKTELVDQDLEIYYNEISVYDRLRFELGQGGKQITMKIRIPQYKQIDSNCYCLIDGIYHQVYNAAHIMTDDTFPETELTLIAPEKNISEAAL